MVHVLTESCRYSPVLEGTRHGPVITTNLGCVTGVYTHAPRHKGLHALFNLKTFT
jgi:hypothetical protein